MCTRVDNQKDAYKSVEAFDLEDGDVGSVNTNISVIVLMDEEEYVRETGCKEPGELLRLCLSLSLCFSL